ncbi:hypothetical protein GCM10009639_55880 [Kitasatospora putterlickiae]|uniref:Uncharacterized protein n=1 Tax=Kitasatospora putterlickiae TaxID=221725 RepID=A0ABN1YE98_9ACTN
MTHGTADPATITSEMARQIRVWRVDEGLTWRSVTQAASDLWGSGSGGGQIYGRDLCAAAANVLGGDPDQEPWN